jgi:hypothetical protein
MQNFDAPATSGHVAVITQLDAVDAYGYLAEACNVRWISSPEQTGGTV